MKGDDQGCEYVEIAFSLSLFVATVVCVHVVAGRSHHRRERALSARNADMVVQISFAGSIGLEVVPRQFRSLDYLEISPGRPDFVSCAPARCGLICHGCGMDRWRRNTHGESDLYSSLAAGLRCTGAFLVLGLPTCNTICSIVVCVCVFCRKLK